jgi:hypothetical protein
VSAGGGIRLQQPLGWAVLIIRGIFVSFFQKQLSEAAQLRLLFAA